MDHNTFPFGVTVYLMIVGDYLLTYLPFHVKLGAPHYFLQLCFITADFCHYYFLLLHLL